MAIAAEHTRGEASRFVEDLDVARFVEPGIIGLAQNATVFAVDLEALVPIHPHRDRQVEMAEGASSKGKVDEPAISPEPLT